MGWTEELGRFAGSCKEPGILHDDDCDPMLPDLTVS